MNESTFALETDIPNEDYFTTTKLADLCGVTRFTVINWVKAGKLKAVSTMGGHRRIPPRKFWPILRYAAIATNA